MFNANKITARGYVCSISGFIMPAGWLQNYVDTIQTQNTFENRNAMSYNLRVFTRILSAQIGLKITIFGLGQKNDILV